MRTRAPLSLLLLLFIAFSACQKQEVVTKSPPQPADVIAIASVKSLTAALAGLQAYVEAVRPGAGAAVSLQSATGPLGQTLGVEGMSGIALDKPLHVIILDPKKYQRPLILLAHADAAALRPGKDVSVKPDGGTALVGEKAAVDLVAPWALAALAKEPAPAALTIRTNLRGLVDRYRADIENGRKLIEGAMGAQAPGVAKVLGIEIDLLMRLAGQTDEMSAVLDASATEIAFELRFTPTAKSTLESFNRAQRPAPIGLLARLPAAPDSAMLLVGHYELGPLRDIVFELMGDWLASWSGRPADAEFRKRWDEMNDHFQGPVAMAVRQSADKSLSTQYAIGVDDGPAAFASIKAFMPPDKPVDVDLFGMFKVRAAPRRPVATHDGVGIEGVDFHFDFSALPPETQALMRATYGGEDMQFFLTGFDKHLVMTMGKAGLDDLKQTIDRLRRGPDLSLSAGAKAVFDAGAGRKASFVIFMNLASMTQLTGRVVPATSGMSMELAFPDGKAVMRIGVPAAHVREIVTAFMPP